VPSLVEACEKEGIKVKPIQRDREQKADRKRRLGGKRMQSRL